MASSPTLVDRIFYTIRAPLPLYPCNFLPFLFRPWQPSVDLPACLKLKLTQKYIATIGDQSFSYRCDIMIMVLCLGISVLITPTATCCPPSLETRLKLTSHHYTSMFTVIPNIHQAIRPSRSIHLRNHKRDICICWITGRSLPCFHYDDDDDEEDEDDQTFL